MSCHAARSHRGWPASRRAGLDHEQQGRVRGNGVDQVRWRASSRSSASQAMRWPRSGSIVGGEFAQHAMIAERPGRERMASRCAAGHESGAEVPDRDPGLAELPYQFRGDRHRAGGIGVDADRYLPEGAGWSRRSPRPSLGDEPHHPLGRGDRIVDQRAREGARGQRAIRQVGAVGEGLAASRAISPQ